MMTDLKTVTVGELLGGLSENESCYECVYCSALFEKGEVFPEDGRFFDAHTAALRHAASHTDRMEQLFRMGERNLSLTENQKKLLLSFAGGLSDAEIAAELGVSASTVRHQRFVLRERAKGAKVYLALWALAEEGSAGRKNAAAQELVTPHKGATMTDQRYEITAAEREKILSNVFLSLEPLKLKVFSPKEKKKIVILTRIAEEFHQGRQYSEAEVNDILAGIWHDFATLRRYLIEYGFLDRKKDGSAYWKHE